ncbi:MAG: malto-oligosyltrehalose synthase [Rhabdochlamydiaceae bacterium]|nr:malto-oligosyltrehalose synthase [Candidatus Amphrikana amoebophyrae]
MTRFTSAYRLQLSSNFPIKKAIKLLPYLKELGIDTVYTCPYFETPKGSLNPYLITSPTHFNPNLGNEHQFSLFFKAIKDHGLNHILDLVSNHLGATVQNEWFKDVLEKGENSKYSNYFDILFDPYYAPLKGKILLPILPTPLDQALNSNYIKLVGSGNSYSLRVGPIALPLSDDSIHWLSQRTFNSKDLSTLLDMQHYLITYWKSCYDIINYRRFFDIVELIGINIERDDVYTDFHKKVFELIESGKVQGLRIDHPDGLKNPAQYLAKLQHDYPGLFVIVEKILQPNERLPKNWRVTGSVGYEYLNLLNGLFINCANEKKMTQVYENFTGVVHKPDEMLYEIKKTILTTYIKAEVNDITHLISKKCDVQFNELKAMLIELFCHIPVYRTYIGEQDLKASPQDTQFLKQAFEKVESSFKPTHKEALKVLRVMFCQDNNPKKEYRTPLLRAQQLMPCVMAKSLEDTFLYRYHRLISLNDVGGSPLTFGTSVKQFHEENKFRQQNCPSAFLATSTHDSKRSEDVRFRINVISHMPDRFEKLITQWHELNKPFNRGLDLNIEYLIYQTLIGFWPGSKIKKTKEHIKRAQAYFLKAIREAKDYTNWIDPNLGYESNVAYFVGSILKSKEFVASLNHIVDEIDPIGKLNSLHAIAIKAGSPGIFDLYQGCEVFDDSLVDPDNRREVDYNRLQNLNKKLSNFKENNKLLDEPISNLHKLHLIKSSLYTRKRYPELFIEGDYIPLEVMGEGKENTIAFARQSKGKTAIIVAQSAYSQLIKLPNGVTKLTDCYFNRPLNIKTVKQDSFLEFNDTYPLLSTS